MIFKKGTRKKLSKNFSAHEFDCPCDHCNITLVKQSTINSCQAARYDLNRALYLTSGYRCEHHNREVGGVGLSNHLDGGGADLACPKEMDIYDFAKVLRKHFLYVKVYVGGNYCHCDNEERQRKLF